jgi:drug/metabolite transporter (DMT)-like permease
MRFLDLVWSSLMGWWVFTEVPSETTWIGASVILLSTLWIARREGQRKPIAAPEP